MKNRIVVLVALVPLIMISAVVYVIRTKLMAQQQAKPAAVTQTRDAVVAQARLEPQGGIIYLGAPIDAVLAHLNVREGDYLKTGDIVAELTTHDLRSSEKEAAALRIARASLGALGAQAQEASIKSIEIDSAQAQRERDRRQMLVDKGSISAAEVENASSTVAKEESEADHARALLTQIQRSTEVDRREAIRALAVADAVLEQTMVRAPVDGEVLRLTAHAGERPGPQGVIVLGDTHHMTAVVEVHANDIRFVKVGQKAQFTSPALTDPIPGKVVRIGTMIFKNNVFGEDPNAPENLRVLEVRVLLDSSEVAGRYTNLEGQVRIDLVTPPVPVSTAPTPAPTAAPTSSAGSPHR